MSRTQRASANSTTDDTPESRVRQAPAESNPPSSLLPALDRILLIDAAPPLQAFLDVGRELCDLQLQRLVHDAIPPRMSHQSCAHHLLVAAARFHDPDITPEARAEAGPWIRRLLDEEGPGSWLLVRAELKKFRTAAREELVKRGELAATEGGGDPARQNWTPYQTVKKWALLFDVSPGTMAKRLKNQTPRNERFNRQNYRIAIADLPPTIRRKIAPLA